MTTKIVNEARKEHNAGTPLLTESEQQQLDAWNATQRNYPRDACVPHLVAGQAAITPGAVALVAGNQRLTYRELNQRANQLAHYLQTLGVGPNVLVGLCVERSLDMVVGLLGILKAGGAYVPLDPSYPPDRLAFMMEDAQAPVLVTQQHLVSRLPAQQAQVICLDTDATVLARQSTTDPISAITADDLVYIIYTSGSTGRPKGVQITHGSLLNLIYWHQRVFAVTAADRATQLTSPAFDATGWELWPYLAIGASVYLLDEDSRVAPALCRDWLVDHAITITFLPTVLAEGVMALEWPKTTALRYLLTGADTLHHYPSPGLPFALVNNYGPTEATVVTTYGLVPPTEHANLPPTIGRPIDNMQVYILDEHLRQVPFGESGELHIGGVGLARGYLNRPDLTEEKFIPHPFSDAPGARLYKTGDEACFLPDGQIAFMGRIDYQIKIRGYRIEPNEIMSVLNEHPAVRTSLVVAREDTAGDKRLVAYVVLSPGAVVSASSLREILAERLPDYMIPATFVQLDSMPLTSSGKVDRRALPAPDATNTLHDEVVAQPHTPMEERLVAIVAPLLGLEHISIDDNFFMLGGHSLLGTQVIAHVANAFGVDLSLRTLFSSPTIRQLSAEIERLIVARVEAMSDEEARRLLEQGYNA
ncbi:MAG: non-ribosomal peptide synthetase [Ktedonobacteraceae bacterium]